MLPFPRIICSILLVSTLLQPAVAAAENQALIELLKALHANGTIDDSTYQLVKQVAEQEGAARNVAAAEKSEAQPQVVDNPGGTEQSKDTTGIVINNRGKLTIDSEDGDFSFRVGGRIQMDAATYAEDSIRHNDGTEFRRARLFVQGTLWHDWQYKLQYDFTASGIDGLQDAYIDYTGFDQVAIRMGHFKEPFGLQNTTSSKYLPFTERALISAFAPGRNLGVQAGGGGDNWSLNLGLFGEGPDGALADDDEGAGIATRATFAPAIAENTRLHMGAALAYRSTGSVDTVRFRERPESHVTNQRLVDTGSINADDFTLVGVEAALVSGPLSIESEYNYLDLNRASATLPDLDFSGYYVQASWFITGESQPYDARSGSFGKPSLNSIVGQGGIGAWQLALRFSSIDLNDADISGGEEQNFSVGLNWYTTPNILLSANYVNVLDVKGGPAADDEPDAFQLRAQVEF